MTELAAAPPGLDAALSKVDLSGLHGQRLFITGGTGFFGRWLLHAIARLNAGGAGIEVCVLSRRPERFLADHPCFARCDWLHPLAGDVKTFTFPPGPFDLLIHAATDTSRAAHANGLGIFDDIVGGSRRTLDFAVAAGVRRVLLISSGAVYGPQPADCPQILDDAAFASSPQLASSAYGEGKRVMEMLGALYAEQHGLECVTARCFAFVGPGLDLDAHFAIGNFIRDALWHQRIVVKGNGQAVRSYLYAADLAVWLLHLLLTGSNCRSYNVGSDQAITTGELARRIGRLLAPDKPVLIEDAQTVRDDLRSCYVPAIVRARRELALDVWTPLDQAIRWTAEDALTNAPLSHR